MSKITPTGQIGLTAGVIVDTFAINSVYNLGSDGTNNLAYKGNFKSFSFSGAAPVGLGLGYSWTPRDWTRRETYAYTIVPTCGAGASVSFSATEYIPLYTVHKDRSITWHTLEYYKEAQGGYVTSKVQWMEGLLNNAVQQYGE